MKKIFISIVLILVIGVLSYLVYIYIFKPKEKTSICFVVFQNQIDESYIDKILTDLKDILKEENDDLSITVNSKPGKVQNFNISTTGLFETSSFFSILKDSLSKITIRDSSLSINDANIQIESMVNQLKNYELGTYKKVFLIGSFPNCYSYIDVVNSVELINNKLDSTIRNNNSTVYWMLKSNEKEPEQEILKALTNLKQNIQNKEVSENQRVCTEKTKKNIYVIFFKKMSESEIKNFVNLLHEEYTNDIRLTIWNSGLLNNKGGLYKLTL